MDRAHSLPHSTVLAQLFLPLSADLRASFETPPYSQKIELGSQAVLRCHPPRGEPAASVAAWRKDGVDVDRTRDHNFIQSSDGHLLIQQARMEDAANYSCVAANQAGLERVSPPARVTVYGKREASLKPQADSVLSFYIGSSFCNRMQHLMQLARTRTPANSNHN